MDPLAASINAVVVAIVGIALAWLGKGRFDGLDRRIDRMERGSMRGSTGSSLRWTRCAPT